jgi:hypothetical protein
MVSLFSVLIQESWCLVEGDLMMGDGWLTGFCVCIFGLSQRRKPSVLWFVVWFLVLSLVLSRLLPEERDVLSLCVCVFLA